MALSESSLRIFYDVAFKRLKKGARVCILGYPRMKVSEEITRSIFGEATSGVSFIEVLNSLGCGQCDVLDVSDYEGANIVADLNCPLPEGVGTYDLVIDNGTIEHCFNVAQAMFNVKRLCAPDGIAFHTNPANWFGHGFWNFSPCVYFDFYHANGFAVEVFLRDCGSGRARRLENKPAVTKILDKRRYTVHAVASRRKTLPDTTPMQGRYSRFTQPGNQEMQSRASHFFFIGASRTGSTWLARAMAQHPQVDMPVKKPVRFWNAKVFGLTDEKSSHPKLSLDDYLTLFQETPERTKGDMTDGYHLLSPTAISAIHGHFPKAKVLMMMRDPMDIALSHFALHGSLRELSIEDVRRQLGRPIGYQHQNIRQVEAFRKWEGIFGKSNVKVFFYEEFFAHPAVEYAKLLEFLGLDRPELEESFYQVKVNKRAHDDAPSEEVTREIQRLCMEPRTRYFKFKTSHSSGR